MDGRIPVTILSGFLGSGKTTVLNRLLRTGEAGRAAVVVNEVGELGVDGQLVQRAEWGLVEILDGCVCCTVLGDLSAALADLIQATDEVLDRIIIETSGLASPGPVVRTLAGVGELRARLRVSGVVAVMHAEHAMSQLESRREVRDQVACADRFLVGHVDRVESEDVDRLEAQLRSIRPDAVIARARMGEIEPKWILEDGEAPTPSPDDGVSHSQGVVTVSLSTEEELDLHALKMWLQFLSARRGQQLLRIKGVFRVRQCATAVSVHGVHEWLEFGPLECAPPQTSTVVIIGDDLDPAELHRGWEVAVNQALRR